MMTKLALVLVLLAACGPKAASPPDQEEQRAAGDVGAVCGCGERADETCEAVACRDGLVCGYGCGIPGCDSTCMTQDEFEDSRTIP